MMAVWHGHYTAAETLLKMGNALVDAENEVDILLVPFPLSRFIVVWPYWIKPGCSKTSTTSKTLCHSWGKC